MTGERGPTDVSGPGEFEEPFISLARPTRARIRSELGIEPQQPCRVVVIHLFEHAPRQCDPADLPITLDRSRVLEAHVRGLEIAPRRGEEELVFALRRGRRPL